MKLNDEIDKMFKLREKKKELIAETKEIGKQIDECEQKLLARLDEVGSTTARGTLASIVKTESLLPVIDDWGEVSDWIMENDAIYLCHRRISSGPWKELRDAGTIIPGITPFTKTAISLTKLRD
jgi:hypothetical protein